MEADKVKKNHRCRIIEVDGLACEVGTGNKLLTKEVELFASGINKHLRSCSIYNNITCES